MSDLLIVGVFFMNLIIIVVLLAIINDLQDIRADLYYYNEIETMDIGGDDKDAID